MDIQEKEAQKDEVIQKMFSERNVFSSVIIQHASKHLKDALYARD